MAESEWPGWSAAAAMVAAFLVPGGQAQAQSRPVDVDVFVSATCPHCAAAKPFIERLRRERPDLLIRVADIADDSLARARLSEIARQRGMAAVGIPAFLIGGELIVGWDEGRTEAAIRARLPARRAGDSATRARPPPPDTTATGTIDLPLVGPVDVRRVGLPAFSFAVGFIDGVNPCAMWALLYLLTLLATMRDRRRMFALGGTFVFVGGALYFAFIAAWFELFRFIGATRPVQLVLGSVALLAGAVHVKDFVALGHGVTLSIPEGAKPRLFSQARRVLTAENLAGAILAVAVFAVLVNVVELLCTAGLPAVYTQILSTQELARWEYYGNLGIYIGAYMLDDAIVLAAAIITLSRARLQKRAARWLELLSGLVLLLLGAALIVRPGLLR